MSAEFDRDLQRARDDIAAGREQLLEVVNALSDDDLDRVRRGGWSVRRVLEHVIESEWLYTRLATHLRDLPQPDETPSTKAPSVAEATRAMGAAREALLAAVAGVDEETFYRLGAVGHEEYSVLSLLENVALHDREHAPQVQEILQATA